MEITYATASSRELGGGGWETAAEMPTRQVKVIPLQHPNQTTSFPSSSASSSSSYSWFSKWKRSWIRTYKWREYLQIDLAAGISVGVMLVPQADSSFVPLFMYAIFGSSHQLAIGPVALVSLLVSNILGEIVDLSDELYTEPAILLALMVGILECVMGLLRLGWLIRFISHSVISGFTTASAITIGLSQAKYFLGYDITHSSKIVTLIKSIIAGIDGFTWQPFVMGSVLLAILLVMKHLGKSRKYVRFLRAAGPITGVVLGTVFVKIFHPSSISVVGDIPQGLPKFSIPKGFEYVKSLIPTTFVITGVAILESVGIAKALAAKNGYELDSNRELVGLGVANICGSFFSAYPTTGSFSRSAVNNEGGAKTGLSGITTGIIIGCALLFLTPLFTDIPECALAAIVISAVIGLVDYEEAIFLWRVDQKDFLLWLITGITTLFLGIEIGVLVGLFWDVFQAQPFTEICNSIQRHKHITGLWLFGLMHQFTLQTSVTSKTAVTYMDSSAVQALKDLYQEYKSRDIQIVIANPNPEVLLTLTKSSLVDLIGKEWYFVRLHDAVQVCLQHVQGSSETPKKVDSPAPEEKPGHLQRLRQRLEDLELGAQETQIQKEADPQLEPLLSRKS
ncbi:STAS domain [Dillenia turbinata]|uniref:STAS domain n=1 Tax=Dillenia turbinata TaxID=194707 RepID=A0AAN8VNM2_9MAGN